MRGHDPWTAHHPDGHRHDRLDSDRCRRRLSARRTWWEAATTTGVALRRYDLHSGDGQLLGSATFWDMQPLAGAWGISASGLLHIHIDAGRRREGLAHYLLGEALYDLGREGVAIVETQAPEENLPARALFAKLGFEAAESGTLFCKA